MHMFGQAHNPDGRTWVSVYKKQRNATIDEYIASVHQMCLVVVGDQVGRALSRVCPTVALGPRAAPGSRLRRKSRGHMRERPAVRTCRDA